MIAIRNMCNELNVDINKIQFVTLSPSDAIAALEKVILMQWLVGNHG